MTRQRLILAAWSGAVLALLGTFCVAEPAPAPLKVPDGLYEKRAEHDPDGIGVFYMGREIAHVMGHTGADWLERPTREKEEGSNLLLESLQIKPGQAVADIGAGSGYYSWRMARLVGDTGKVFAVDIQQEMLDLLMKQMTERGVGKIVRPVLGTVTDPKLAPASCDLMLLVDVYHEFDHPYEMLRAMIAALKPGGRLAFVEFRLEDPAVAIKTVHKMTEAQVKKEMALHPELVHTESIERLPQQHLIIFTKK